MNIIQKKRGLKQLNQTQFAKLCGVSRPYIAHLEKCFNAESAKGSNMTSAERKRVKAIEAAINDCKAYNLTLQAVADESIAIDLDDGVVVNWEKYKSVLAKL